MSVASSPEDFGDWSPPHFAPVPFGRMADELLSLYEPPLRAVATLRGMRHMLAAVADLLPPDATTAELTPALVARLLASRPDGMSPYSLRSLLAKFKVAVNYALSQGYIRSSPFAFRKSSSWIRPGQPAGKGHHPIEDIRRVLDLLAVEVQGRQGWARWRARRLEALTATVAYTGLRAHEAIRLRVEDVDLEARIIHVVSRSGNRLKTSSSAQPVPIPDGLAGILGRWHDRRLDAPEGMPRVGHHAARPDAPTGDLCPYVFCNVTRTNAWQGGPRGHRPLDQLKAAGERAGGRG